MVILNWVTNLLKKNNASNEHSRLAQTLVEINTWENSKQFCLKLTTLLHSYILLLSLNQGNFWLCSNANRGNTLWIYWLTGPRSEIDLIQYWFMYFMYLIANGPFTLVFRETFSYWFFSERLYKLFYRLKSARFG